MRHEQLKRDMLVKRRASCAVKDDEVRDRIALINTPVFHVPDSTEDDEQEPHTSSQDTRPKYQEDREFSIVELQQQSALRKNMDEDFEDGDFFLATAAGQRYSFTKYEDEDDPQQLSTIFESSYPHMNSELKEINTLNTLKIEELICENSESVVDDENVKRLSEDNYSEDRRTSSESADSSVKYMNESESVNRDKVAEKSGSKNSNLNGDVDNIMEITADALNIDFKLSDRGSESDANDQQFTKSDLSSNSFETQNHLPKNYDTSNSNDVSSSAKLVMFQSKSELARRERERRNLIRAKVEAASVIQRWYRRGRGRKQNKRVEDVLDVQKELVQQVAALTIQLVWRKYIRQRYQSTTDRRPNKAVHSESLRSNDSHETNMSVVKSKSRNKVSDVRRPTLGLPAGRRPRMDSKLQSSYGSIGRLRKTALYSPAAASYNLALDMQNPIVAKRGNTRTSTPRRGANNKIRPSTSRRTTSARTAPEGIQSRKSQR
jgi:hypothetical protein